MGRRLPAEWEFHSATVVAWPGRSTVWGQHLGLGRSETLELVQAIAKSESVIIAVDPAHSNSVNAGAHSNRVEAVEIPLDDCWARDISPLFAVEDEGTLTAVDFVFNAWGGKFSPHDRDAAFGAALSQHLDVSRHSIPLVFEGGSMTTDGQGTAIIVEPTVVNGNRNPDHTRGAVENLLHQELGITQVIWLPFGLLGDTDTDGHVDNVAVFCGPGRVLAQAPPLQTHPDADRLASNQRVLARARDASGRQLEVVDVPWLPVSPLDPHRPSSYINSYPTNESILVPVVGTASDEAAMQLIATAFVGREPIAIPSSALSVGGGGPHCMTMQVPHPGPQQRK